MAQRVIISSIDLFLSRDCAGGAGPDVELARGADADPDPKPVPGPVVAALLPAPNAEAPGAEGVSAAEANLAGPEGCVVPVGPAAVVAPVLFAKRFAPGVTEVAVPLEGAVALVTDDDEG